MAQTKLPILSFHEWSYLRTELVWIYDHPVPEDVRHVTWDRTEGHWAWYVRRGQVKITSDSGTYTAGPGMWLMLPREAARQDFSHDISILSVYFLCQWPSGENLFATKAGLVVKGVDHPELERAAIKMERLVRRHLPRADIRLATQLGHYPLFLRLQGLFLNWLQLWFQVRVTHGASLTRLHSGDDRAMRAVRCLNEAPVDRGFPHNWLASETGGLSLTHLDRIFVGEFGLTTRKYWERRRLEAAKIYLETSSTLSVKEIAHRTGFRSDAHFVMWFKRLVGQSPLHYRRKPRDPSHPKRFFDYGDARQSA